MARRKKTGRRRTRRGARMGAIGGDLNLLLGVAAGALVGQLIAANKQLQTTIQPQFMAFAQAGLGLVGAGMKQPILRAVSIGLFANGTIALAKNFGMISGIGQYPISNYPPNYRTDPALEQNVAPLISGPNYDNDSMGVPELALISGMFDEYS